MVLLGLKLILTPCLIGLVSLAGRKWGPSVSGWLTGLPLTSGPIALYLALERGPDFAAGAASGTLAGLISVAIFCLIYYELSFKLNWAGCLLIGWAGYFGATFIFQEISPPLLVTYLAVIATLALASRIMSAGKNRAGIAQAARGIVAPRYDLAFRMLLATAFVVGLTASADFLGARLSGLLSPFPIFASILAAFTHHLQGPQSTRRYLQGTIIGAFTFATFFVCFGGLVEPDGPTIAFGGALLVALLAQGGTIWLVRYSHRRQPA
jgi:hypothetical protein